MDDKPPQETPAAVRGPAAVQASITRAEAQLGTSLPQEWTDTLRRDGRVVSAHLATGQFIMVLSCDQALDMMDAWAEGAVLHPGFYPLGSDGGREMYCLDLRDSGRGVQLVQLSSSGWDDAILLNLSLREFIDAIDSQRGFAIPWPEDPA